MRQITLAEFLNNRFEGLQVESLFDKYEKKITSSKKQIQLKVLRKIHNLCIQLKNMSKMLAHPN